MGKFLGALPSKDTQKRARMNCQLNSCPYSTYYVTFHINRFAIGKTFEKTGMETLEKSEDLPVPRAPYEFGHPAPAAGLFLYCSERDGEKAEEPRSMDSRLLAPVLPPLAMAKPV